MTDRTDAGHYTANEWFHFWEQTKAENDMLRAKVASLQAELSGLTLELRQVQGLLADVRREVADCRDALGSGSDVQFLD